MSERRRTPNARRHRSVMCDRAGVIVLRTELGAGVAWGNRLFGRRRRTRVIVGRFAVEGRCASARAVNPIDERAECSSRRLLARGPAPPAGLLNEKARW